MTMSKADLGRSENPLKNIIISFEKRPDFNYPQKFPTRPIYALWVVEHPSIIPFFSKSNLETSLNFCPI